MGFELDSERSTPLKLSLFSLPSQPPEPPGMLTPPLRPLASVPFQWEEAPGKPRSAAAKSTTVLHPKPKAAKCLDLPPRLYHEAKITNMPSPTTVLDGPYPGRTLLHTLSSRSFRSLEGGTGKRRMKGEKLNFGSWRLGSFVESRKDWRGSFDFSHSVGGYSEGEFSNVKITGLRKRSSSFFGSSKSHLLANLYASVKQAVYWRRKQ